jgi:cysteinyl-tRNA synthetase
MITVNNQKMAKSLNNGISIEEFFSGNHTLLDKAYSPMTLKFFILQAHYRGTLDFSNAALTASEKGLNKLLTASETLKKLKTDESADSLDIAGLKNKCEAALDEDLNTPILISALFEMVTLINQINAGQIKIKASELEALATIFNTFVFEVLGLKTESENQSERLHGLIEVLIEMRNEAKLAKNYALSDDIRKKLSALGVELKDGKEGTSFSLN